MIENFHFIRPLFLLLIPVGLALTYLLWSSTSGNSNWRDVCDPHLIKHLLVGKQIKKSPVAVTGMMLGWIIAVLAMAGPTWERLPQQAHDAPQGRAIVFDLSRSMDSTDVQPSRLVRARYKLVDLILAGEGLQQGLVVFAGDAFVVAPLTDDTDTLVNLAPSLKTNTIPVQGSRAELGLELGATLIRNTGLKQGNIILITDGVSAETQNTALQIAAEGYSVSVLAVGTAGGGTVKLGDGALLKDASGNIIVPGVDHDALRQVASAGNGKYVPMSVGNTDIEVLMRPSLGALSATLGDSLLEDVFGNAIETAMDEQFKSDLWKDNGVWLVLPLLLIVALGFRRGWVLGLALLLMPLSPQPALAFDWTDLWLRGDQQAAEHFSAEKYQQIPNNAPIEWRAAAKYRSGDFEGAASGYSIRSFDDNIANDAYRARTHYNRGNALAQSMTVTELVAAISAYESALNIDPDMEDAKFNKELIESLLTVEERQVGSQGEGGEPSDGEKGGTVARDADDQDQDNSGEEDSEDQETAAKAAEEQSDADEEANEDEDENGFADSEQNEEDGERPAFDAPSDEPSDENENPDDDSNLLISEQEQALEQWLHQIPDDPGGLLRRKFNYQYSTRDPQSNTQKW